PAPANRTLDHDSCLVALMAVNDETRDPSQWIGPTNSGPTSSSLYAILRCRVWELKSKDLPGLEAILRKAKRPPPKPAKVRKPQGRPKSQGHPNPERRQLVEAWQRAKAAGIKRLEFCKDRNIKVKELERMMDAETNWRKRNPTR